MQKHQEWLENKTYQQHLHVLQRIKETDRKLNIKSAIPAQNRSPNFEDRSRSSGKTNKKKQQNGLCLALKDRQLSWENFLLGKRIIETTPVICQRKQVHDYNKNRKILDLRAKVCRGSDQKSNFRESKLKEYTENTWRINEKFRIQTACQLSRILSLRFASMEIYRTKYLPFEDIFLKYKFQNKTIAKQSEIVNIKKLFLYTFYITISKHKKENTQMNIEMIEMKGLKEVLIGTFLVDLNWKENCLIEKPREILLQRYGREVGQAQIATQIIKRSEIYNKF